MKKLFILIIAVCLFAVPASADTINLAWEQPCVDGCPDPITGVPTAGEVIGWRVYMGDATGVYDPTPIITMTYDGTPAPEYFAPDYVLTLTGSGSKFFVVTAYNPNVTPPESAYSNEVEYEYNVLSPNVPVTLRFTITP